MKFKIVSFLLSLILTVSLTFGNTASPQDSAAGSDVTEANITRVTTSLLEHSQFSQHPLDAELAGKFLERYMDSLDSKHVLFLQSDQDEFERYRGTLGHVMRDFGDNGLAQVIFKRYIDRLKERESYVTTLLQQSTFDFSGSEVYSLDRENATRPKDLAAAKVLWSQQLRAEYLQEKLENEEVAEIRHTLAHHYTQLTLSAEQMKRDDILNVYLNALTHVYDPHSDYFGREEYDNFAISMNLSLVGIGATLQTEDGYCKVIDLVPGGPAARSGALKPGDRIVAVAQGENEAVSLENIPAYRAVQLIRGEKGTVVRLSVIPAGAPDDSTPRVVRLVRDNVKLEDAQASARVIEFPTSKTETIRLGLIDLPSFYAEMDEKSRGNGHFASADVSALLEKLKAENVRGIILDLRHNGGGSLDEAIKLTGLFIGEGPIVQTRGPSGDIEIGADKDPTIQYDGPLIVLTSRFSASASEILAGALQDYGRALIVGDSTTFGKGTVQSIVPLASIMNQYNIAHTFDPGALKLTIRKFYRPSGTSTQLRGVASDIVIPSLSDLSEVSESAMKDPLPWDSIPAAHFEPVNQVRPYLPVLLARSQQRITSEKEFAYLRDEFNQFKMGITNKTISLNETQRRREMAVAEACQREFEKEATSITESKPTTYQITLSSLTLPLTNANASVPQSGKSIATGDNTAKDQSLADEIILNETEHILTDYISLLGNHTTPSVAAR